MSIPALTAPAPKRPRGRPRKTLDERDEGNRRVQLVKAAARLFRRKGFDATSTRDIASAVGMHSGSPFYHFKSKGDLLYAVMEQGMKSALERQAAVLAPDDDTANETADAPADQLRRLIRSHFDTLHGPGRDFIPVMRSRPCRKCSSRPSMGLPSPAASASFAAQISSSPRPPPASPHPK